MQTVTGGLIRETRTSRLAAALTLCSAGGAIAVSLFFERCHRLFEEGGRLKERAKQTRAESPRNLPRWLYDANEAYVSYGRFPRLRHPVIMYSIRRLVIFHYISIFLCCACRSVCPGGSLSATRLDLAFGSVSQMSHSFSPRSPARTA